MDPIVYKSGSILYVSYLLIVDAINIFSIMVVIEETNCIQFIYKIKQIN